MILIKRISPVIFLALLTSCATPYGPNSWTGGYTDEKVDEDTYIISFYGNGYASEERVWNFWIYRCAELTTLKGYDYFALTPLEKTSKLEDKNIGGKLYEFGRVDQSIFNDLAVINGNYDFEDVYYYYYTVTTYSSRARVDMYRNPVPPDVQLLLHARTIMDLLGEYIKTNGKSRLPARKELVLRATVEASVRRLQTMEEVRNEKEI
ncbi:MAG TPA: hypothetical protein VF268_16655 [Gammaproteobacteria bacterium]